MCTSPKDENSFDDDVYSESVHDTLQQIDLVHRLAQRFPDHLIAASTTRDVQHNFATYPGRISSLIGIEGLHQIGNSASTLRLYHQLGVRYVTLTHTCHNKYADSAAPSKPLYGGLSAEGVDLVREMNRMGMMVDLSHTSADTQRHALNVSLAPVLFSHSNAYSLCKHTRNVPDDVLKLVKQNNGVVMVTFLPDFVKEGGKGASLGDVADHIEYIGNLIGYQHVGLGSDFDGMESAPAGLEDVSKYPALIEELLRRGVSAENVKNLMGLNILRVLGDVEKIATDLGTKMNPLQDKVKSMF
jgi:membrane dipeptidase